MSIYVCVCTNVKLFFFYQDVRSLLKILNVWARIFLCMCLPVCKCERVLPLRMCAFIKTLMLLLTLLLMLLLLLLLLLIIMIMIVRIIMISVAVESNYDNGQGKRSVRCKS